MYRVGVVDSPQDDDQEFEELADAEECAIITSYNDCVIAVWDVEEDEIVLLVYQQRAYTA